VSLPRSMVMGALAVGGVLVVLAGLKPGRGALHELVTLLVVIILVFLAGRAAWRWWKSQPRQIGRAGLLGAFGMAGAGWVLVVVVHALSRVSSENYGMILVWPLVYVVGIPTMCGGVLAAAVGVVFVVTVLKEPAAHRQLIALAGAAACRAQSAACPGAGASPPDGLSGGGVRFTPVAGTRRRAKPSARERSRIRLS
jgi:hypothetical protein